MKISILPDQFGGDPQSVAMLQAFYSRSIEPIDSRLEKLGNDLTKVRKALKQYYLGYGHNSIAEGGSVTLFVENVSILAAKAIQEDPQYRGQECSSRYIELSGEGHPSGGSSAKEWAELQKEILAKLIISVREKHPFTGLQVGSHATWLNATAARAFDIARGWIPASALTNLSVHMTIRQLNDMTARLAAHPLVEVVEIAHEMKRVLAERYTDACSPEYSTYDREYVYWLSEGGINAWYYTVKPLYTLDSPMNLKAEARLTPAEAEFLSKRPKYAAVPSHMQNCITFEFDGVMDYGTWRDLQRHRRNTGAPPLLTASYGFNAWYLNCLDDYLSEEDATKFKNSTIRLTTLFKSTRKDPVQDQYRLPIGMNVSFAYTFGLAQAVYLAELRSGNTVHAILRPFAQYIAEQLETVHGVKVYYDKEPARFDLKRGTQTITENA